MRTAAKRLGGFWAPATLLLSLIAGNAQALGTSVLSNFGQASSGAVLDLGVRDLEAIPFTTDGSFTELDFIEITATTLFAPGGLIVSIWTVDYSDPSNLKPGSFLTALRGTSAPQGLERYSGRQPPNFTPFSLQPATSYFLVLSIENGGSKVVIDTIDANGTDASPAPLYQFGTDTDGNGSVDRNVRCGGSRANDFFTITWDCSTPIRSLYFPKLRFVAEEPVPPANFSLTANPQPLDFGLVSVGATSSIVSATIQNDGNVDQAIGALSSDSRFSLAVGTDNCSGTTLTPGTTCTVGLTFTPDHGGRITGTLLIPATGDPRSPYSLSLVGEGDAPVIPQPSPATVGGVVTGLIPGESVVLQNNAGDDLSVSADGAFTFASSVNSGDPYSVTVLTQPGPVTEICAVANGNGTISNSDVTNVAVTCSISNFTVGGAVSGLAAGQGVQLLNLGGDAQILTADGAFTFTAQADGSTYSVTIGAQPLGQTCTVANGTGNLAGAAVSNVAVNCVDNQHAIGGLLTGLVAGDSVVLQNNGGDNLALTSDGAFSFSTTQSFGDPYAVTVLTQPAGEDCTVSNASGTTPDADITNVNVVCALTSFSVGGMVQGLAVGQTVRLRNNGADEQNAVNGAFVFSPQADGSAYAVTVATQPQDVACSVTGGTGTVVGANVSSVSISCADALPPQPPERPIPVPLPFWMLGAVSLVITVLVGRAYRRKH